MGLPSASYFDASGNKDHPFLTVAGAAAPNYKWIRFQDSWNAVLQSEGVSEFRAADFAASRGEYRNWKGDTVRRSAFIRRLAKVASSNVNRLFISTIGIREWAEVNKQYPIEETFHCRYALAGFAVANLAIKWAQRKRVKDPFEIVFEDGDEGWGWLESLLSTRSNFKPFRKPKTGNIPFQLADMIAWKARIAATNIDKKRRCGEDLEGLLEEVTSLEQSLMAPAHEGIFTIPSLIKTCEKMGIGQRRNGTCRGESI